MRATGESSGRTGRARPGRTRAGAVVGLVLVAAVGVVAVTAREAPVAADTCAPTALLVNPCRPWLGAVADAYPGLGGLRGQVEGHEARIGRQVDVVHWYHSAGKVTLSADERALAARGSILYLNWKPADRWADATGATASVNAQIDTMADQIKALGRPMMLSIFGEPERFASPGTSTCPGLKGNAGSPASYKAMWANVQTRFAARGVSNVVWVMNYLGYAGWDCFFPELWPGNDRVDWITWDPYVKPGQRWDTEVGYFYDALERRTDAAHAFTSKAWGLAEYGYWRGTADQADAYRMYRDALAWIRAGDHPRLKLYEVYDTISGTTDIRTGYSSTGAADPQEQALYTALAGDPTFRDPVAPPPTTTTAPPTTTTTVPPTTTTVPPPPPGTNHLSGCDTSVETGLSCLSGTVDGVIWPTLQTADGHTGSRSAQVTNTLAATGTHGVVVRPSPVAATEAGRTYTGGVWVRASRAGLDVGLLLRERRPDRSAPPDGYRRISWVSTDTAWHLLSGTYVGQEPGNELTVSMSATGMRTGDWVRYDDASLTSVRP